MNDETKAEIEKLAYHIWKSAGEDYGRAIDFWLMAETMVLELSASAARFTQEAMSTAAASATRPPIMRNAYIQHITMLANAMWQASGAQMGSALDFWLAAERHIRVLTERAARAAGATVGADEAVARMFDSFSPEAYLDEIRRIAYGIWETAGHQYGSGLDIWLAAERQFLETHVAIAPARPSGARKKWHEAAAPEAVAARAVLDIAATGDTSLVLGHIEDYADRPKLLEEFLPKGHGKRPPVLVIGRVNMLRTSVTVKITRP